MSLRAGLVGALATLQRLITPPPVITPPGTDVVGASWPDGDNGSGVFGVNLQNTEQDITVSAVTISGLGIEFGGSFGAIVTASIKQNGTVLASATATPSASGFTKFLFAQPLALATGTYTVRLESTSLPNQRANSTATPSGVITAVSTSISYNIGVGGSTLSGYVLGYQLLGTLVTSYYDLDFSTLSGTVFPLPWTQSTAWSFDANGAKGTTDQVEQYNTGLEEVDATAVLYRSGSSAESRLWVRYSKSADRGILIRFRNGTLDVVRVFPGLGATLLSVSSSAMGAYPTVRVQIPAGSDAITLSVNGTVVPGAEALDYGTYDNNTSTVSLLRGQKAIGVGVVDGGTGDPRVRSVHIKRVAPPAAVGPTSSSVDTNNTKNPLGQYSASYEFTTNAPMTVDRVAVTSAAGDNSYAWEMGVATGSAPAANAVPWFSDSGKLLKTAQVGPPGSTAEVSAPLVNGPVTLPAGTYRFVVRGLGGNNGAGPVLVGLTPAVFAGVIASASGYTFGGGQNQTPEANGPYGNTVLCFALRHA